ncbi:ADP-ribosylation factor-like protein [Carpediemonas membranifera]|uniref:ADP-ribosylation factor-like protein n=1 Tax=Carpediemonas membranifera TaxID=201153 RepID=A0A8J6E1P6_9EUKA|nr:ADP-ribosylation factor-like protein [Carpediemonas membranifera]|eukprot:KAG9393728.1 ADP-ribosylation factor-like protein [Carpediemonas membranifera]
MGAYLSRFTQMFNRHKDYKILMVGLDAAGKTTILYRLQLGEVVSTIPTVGFNLETVQFKNVKFQVFDLGGQTSSRNYWNFYYNNVSAVVFVVDSSDMARMPLAREEFQKILKEEMLDRAPVIVFANKADKEGASDVGTISQALGLQDINDRTWHVVATSAVDNTGLEDGLEWLAEHSRSD